MSSAACRRKEHPENQIVLKPFLEVKHKFFRFLEMILQLLGDQVKILARLDEIIQGDGKQHCQHHGGDGGNKKENVGFHQCVHMYNILRRRLFV